MAESNIVETQVIYGRTNYVNVTTGWRTVALNPAGSAQVFKVNSLFVSNKSDSNAVDIDIRLGRIANGANTYFQFVKTLTIPLDATLIAICRDNPVYLQEGDFIQVRAGADNRADAVASFELIAETPVTTPTITEPSAPLNLVAEPGNAAVTLYWSAPQANGGTDILDYAVELASRQTSSAAWSAFAAVSKPESDFRSFNVTGLTNGWEYKFRVRAVNVIGPGPYSDESNIVSPTSLTAPDAPAAAGFDSAALVSWTEPASSGYSGITISGYRLRWSTDDGQTWLPDATGIATNSPSTSRTIFGLTNGLPYVFSVQALTDSGASPWSPVSAPAAPNAAAGQAPINAANYNLTANWGAVTSGGAPTTVGSIGATTYYGAYDMAGNVNEYTESRDPTSVVNVFALGGSFASAIPGGSSEASEMRSDFLASPGGSSSLDSGQIFPADPELNNPNTPRPADIGFRLVTIEAAPIVKHNNNFVAINDINNAGYDARPLGGSFYANADIGSVAYAYSIQKYPVTNNEYAEFLNAVDASGANGKALWSSLMGSEPRGGINYVSSNASGAKYVVKTDMGNKPVNYVSYYSGLRYANWMHNGCPTTGVQNDSTTENGAYDFAAALGQNSDPTVDFENWAAYPSDPWWHVRTAAAKYMLPTVDEWVKAAYYDPTLDSGNGGYWLYATRSNNPPSPVTADASGDGVY